MKVVPIEGDTEGKDHQASGATSQEIAPPVPPEVSADCAEPKPILPLAPNFAASAGVQDESDAPELPAYVSPLGRAIGDLPAARWSVTQVVAWVGTLGLPRDIVDPLAAALADNEVDGAVLLALSREELKGNLGVIKLGQLKLMAGIEELKAPLSPLGQHTEEGEPFEQARAKIETAGGGGCCQLHVRGAYPIF